MASRFKGTGTAVAVLGMFGLALPVAGLAAETPRYTNFGITYEETDIKLGVDPSDSEAFNDGDFYLWNIQAGLGITDWAHVAATYFTGDCNNCGTVSVDPRNVTDRDLEGYTIGAGVNPTLGIIGLDAAQLMVRASYVDLELDNPIPGGSDLDGDGLRLETHLRFQINEAADIWAGTDYQKLDQNSGSDLENMDVVIGLNYEVWNGVALTASGNIFNNASGFDVGVRWFFGDQLLDGDSLFGTKNSGE